MRIAYVDVNVRYLNRTRDDLIAALVRCGDLTCIGPGFSLGDPVKQLESLLLNPGKVDVIVTTPHIALASGLDKTAARDIAALYRKTFAFDFLDSDFQQLSRLNAVIAKAEVPRVVLLLEADYYNFGKNEISSFNNTADRIFGFGPESWCRKAEMRHLMEESFAAKATNYWADFLEAHGDKVSSLHHLVGDDEFCSLPLAQRPHSWSVMGVGYRAREVAQQSLRAHGISPLTTGYVRKVLAGLRKAKILKGESAWSLDLVQRDFRKKLWDSRYSYTCGSGLDMPIRKFFEIPAAGAVLVCRSFRGARELGFRAGENFIECEPADIMDAHRFLEANPDKAQAIANAGRELVMQKHSVSARSEQLRQALDALIRGKGVGRWSDGQYRIQ